MAPDANSGSVPGTLTSLGRDPTTGILTQIDLTVNLPGGTSAAVSPDDRNIYVTASPYNVVFELNRDTGTGEVVDGSFSCIAESPSPPFCTEGAALDGAASVAVSPDGKSVYVASSVSDAIAIFSRDTSSGEPTSAGFANPTALNGPQSVTVSPDGKSVYAAAQAGDAVVVFNRNAVSGALTQKALPAGCISDTSAAGCTDGEGLNGAYSVTVAPDGESVYVGSRVSDAVALFDRNTTTGALTQKPGKASCISSNATLAAVCETGIGLNSIRSVTVSPDGKDLYTAATVSDAVAVFDRETPPPVDPPVVPPVDPPVVPPVSPPADTTLKGSASAKKKQKQKGKKIVVRATAKANEDLAVKASGTVKVKKKSYKLKPQSRNVSSGKSKTLKLKPKKKDAGKIARALKKGKKAKAKLTVS